VVGEVVVVVAPSVVAPSVVAPSVVAPSVVAGLDSERFSDL